MRTYEVIKPFGDRTHGERFDVPNDPQGVYKGLEQQGFIRLLTYSPSPIDMAV
jgi:hypothetical protein